ncbi:MAG: diaminopimelate decarboxylase [Paramuribaculum sp.]|nr:diaminopimelate decarboxylase [Paramuribaculum sp.]
MSSATTVGTPFYFYDMELLRQTVAAARAAAANPMFRIHYAMKANVEIPVLEVMREAGFGIDTVSGGEISRAVDCGFDPARIVFAGVGKSDAEIDLAIEKGIGCFNVESIEELEVIAGRARVLGKKARVALRVNPNIDAHTHHYITTGLAENKFGIALEMLDRAIDIATASDDIDFRGLHFHIGSQITTLRPFEILSERINDLQDRYESRGIRFATINVGGGLGIDYENPDTNPIPDFEGYFSTFSKCLRIREGQEIHFELGRSMVGQCASLITRVLYVKHGLEKQFAIIDAGFTDLIRPALYEARHLIENLTSDATETAIYDVVGPICESSDVFDKDTTLPITSRGDLLALRSAGAYGSVMAMQYNCRSLPRSVFSE